MAEKKKFKVLVTRIAYASHSIEVEAESELEARELAIDEAGNLEFREHSSDYVVDAMEELK